MGQDGALWLANPAHRARLVADQAADDEAAAGGIFHRLIMERAEAVLAMGDEEGALVVAESPNHVHQQHGRARVYDSLQNIP